MRAMMTAILAAYLLILQALVGGIATGAHAGSAFALDEFGQIICRGAMDGTGSPADPAHHTPDCCATGCNVTLSAAAPPPAIALAAPLFTFAAAPLPPRIEAGRSGLTRRPQNARAPPLA